MIGRWTVIRKVWAEGTILKHANRAKRAELAALKAANPRGCRWRR